MNSANEIVDHCLLQYTIDRLTNLFIYRKVFCPTLENNCQSNKILFKDVIEHMETSHKGEFFDLGKTNVAGLHFHTPKTGLKTGTIIWKTTKFTSTCGATFFAAATTVKDSVCLWVTFFGSSDEAENYSCSISMETKIGKKIQKFNYIGTVHTIDEGSDDIIASGLLLNVGINAAITSLNEEKQLKFEITIRNLKEEAKDDDVESGVSDGDMFCFSIQL